jgi:CRP/FNR family transcriptional regulator, cyclic AMP receptor protein
MNANSTTLEGKQSVTVDSLPEHPLFRGLSERHRQIMTECSERASFDAGEVVVETGEPTDRFFLLVSGSIRVETRGERDPVKVQTIGPGGILGWSWLFPPSCWNFDAIAEEPTEAIFFSSSRLCQACNRDREFGLELFRRMSPAKRSQGFSTPSEN